MTIDYKEFEITVEQQAPASYIGHVRRKDGRAFAAAQNSVHLHDRHALNHLWSTAACSTEEAALAEAKLIADAGSMGH